MMTIIFIEKLHGVNYHRLVVPFLRMRDQGQINLHVVTDAFELLDFNLDHVDNFVVSRTIYARIQGMKIFEKRLKDAGVKFIVDLDDYWEVRKSNPVWKHWQGYDGFGNAIKRTVRAADEIWTPNPRLAKEIKMQLNPHAEIRIVPNAINPNEQQWQGEKVTGEHLWFGYTGASSHMEDVQLLKHIDWSKHKTVAVRMKDAFYDEFFQTELTYDPMSVFEYGEMYRRMNVSLVPLKDNKFNRMKSSLKMIEAGFTRTAVIASDVYPYNEIVINGETGILCSTPEEWTEAINGMTKERAQQLGDNLYEAVRHDYHIDKVNEERLKGLNHVVSNVQ